MATFFVFLEYRFAKFSDILQGIWQILTPKPKLFDYAIKFIIKNSPVM